MAEKDSKQDNETKVSILHPEETGMRVGISSTYTGERTVEDVPNDLFNRIDEARKEYFRFYEENPEVWGVLDSQERFDHLVVRLSARGVKFTEPELITLKVSLLTTKSRKQNPN
ncbi:MAG: hypothetical protein NTZ25_01575 [Candidatus Peregrinibacteria bacterium]|nr:hypothetical protein [Candidatus Peregrinibacteria bacterium]